MTAISLSSLTKRFGEVTALDGLDLELPAGRITALLGPSGCGKTTTLKLIGGLTTPTDGSVRFDGVDQSGVRAEHRQAVMVFQDHLLFPYLSVADNVAFGLRMRGVGGRRRRALAEEMLERVGLPGTAERSPEELSGGQRQRVALARALVVEPQVLLLDEPLASLDPHLRDGMRDLILEVQRDLAVTTVVVTHDQEEAAVLADRIAVMFDGRVAQVGTARELHDRPAGETVARFLGSPNLLPGVRSGHVVATAAGDLAVPNGVAEDGPVVLTI
jgi:ABC-type Fe3+/spermidine/putrescine transport system ATPase subunit